MVNPFFSCCSFFLGSITSCLGKQLGLKKRRVYGCDVKVCEVCSSFLLPLQRYANADKFSFSFVECLPNSNLDFNSNSISLVTALMSLHHVPCLSTTLDEFFRILKPGISFLKEKHLPCCVGGYFLLREHDCNSTNFKVVLDIMHGLYSLVWSSPQGMLFFSFGLNSILTWYIRGSRLFRTLHSLLQIPQTMAFGNRKSRICFGQEAIFWFSWMWQKSISTICWRFSKTSHNNSL